MTRTLRTNQRLRRWTLAMVGMVLLGLLWQQVFLMTGLLWWNAPARGEAVKRPDPPRFRAPSTDWVDLDAYLRTHPVWQF